MKSCINYKFNTSTMTTITTIWSTHLNILFTSKGKTSISTTTCYNFNNGFINKHITTSNSC